MCQESFRRVTASSSEAKIVVMDRPIVYLMSLHCRCLKTAGTKSRLLPRSFQVSLNEIVGRLDLLFSTMVSSFYVANNSQFKIVMHIALLYFSPLSSDCYLTHTTAIPILCRLLYRNFHRIWILMEKIDTEVVIERHIWCYSSWNYVINCQALNKIIFLGRPNMIYVTITLFIYMHRVHKTMNFWQNKYDSLTIHM